MRRRALTEARLSWRCFVAFAATAVAFVLSSVYANWLSVEIERQTGSLIGNVLPSMVHLAAANDDLRDMGAGASDYANLAPTEGASARAHVDDLRRSVEAELASYRQAPIYPGEELLYRDVPVALQQLDAAVAHLYANVDAGELDQARLTADREVRVRADDASRMLRELARENAVKAEASSMEIQRTRRRAATAAAILDVLTVGLTAVLALWLWRVFRAFARLQADHARLVEQRAQELEVFGGRVAHDLLSPLSSLTFSLAAFKPSAAGDPKLAEALRRVSQSVGRTRALVDGLLEFARSGGAPSPGSHAEVAEVVQQAVDDARVVCGSEGAQIEVGPLPDCCVRCTSGVLASVLGNLLRNAMKFMRDSVDRRVWIRAGRQHDRVRFEVQDTGPGVPDGFERAIFEPYVRGPGVTQPGLGLGLATVKRLCEAHGGDAGVRRAPEGGSVFWFTLPVVEEATASASKAAPSLRREASAH